MGRVSYGGGYSRGQATWVGKNINNLVAEKGYSDETITTPNKNKVYVYCIAKHSNGDDQK
jgi:hypothetical protein